MKQNEDLRYERKYIIDKGKENIFCNFLIENNFSKSYESRIVNSIYYDTLDLNFFNDNLDGISNRIKYRFRWYNNKNLSLFLEEKKRNNFIGKKNKLFISNFNNQDELFKFLKNYSFKYNEKYEPLFPILKISYFRSYWLSQCKKYRATIDTEINVECIKGFNSNKFPLEINFNVLEFKYPIKIDKNFRNEHFIKKNIFRLQKNSKYVTGLIILKNANLI